MKKVVAKFKCTEKRKDETYGNHITLTPVIGGSPENEAFYKATPGGACTLGTINDEAAEAFEEGKEYFITFEQAPAAEAAEEAKETPGTAE